MRRFAAALLLAALLFAAVGAALAQDSRMWGSIGFTKHADPGLYCSVNPGVFRIWRWSDWQAFLGAHQKSDCDIGGVGGVAWLPWKPVQKVSAGAAALLLTDYGPPLFPAVAPAVSYDEKRYGADFIFIPRVIAHLRWRWSFD